MRQVEINALLVRRAQLGQTVVRLKGGDPFIERVTKNAMDRFTS